MQIKLNERIQELNKLKSEQETITAELEKQKQELQEQLNAAQNEIAQEAWYNMPEKRELDELEQAVAVLERYKEELDTEEQEETDTDTEPEKPIEPEGETDDEIN